MAAVGDPVLRVINETGKNHCPVDPGLFLVLHVFFIQTHQHNLTSELFALESLLSFFFDPCIRRDDAAHVRELLC